MRLQDSSFKATDKRTDSQTLFTALSFILDISIFQMKSQISDYEKIAS